MRTRVHQPEPIEATASTQPHSGDDRAELRERGAELLAAADAAITRALSRDSTQFLAQNRQLGGQ